VKVQHVWRRSKSLCSSLDQGVLVGRDDLNICGRECKVVVVRHRTAQHSVDLDQRSGIDVTGEQLQGKFEPQVPNNPTQLSDTITIQDDVVGIEEHPDD